MDKGVATGKSIVIHKAGNRVTDLEDRIHCMVGGRGGWADGIVQIVDRFKYASDTQRF